MKICIIADIHLPYNKNAIQYRAFDFALTDAKNKGAELIIFCGDQTADGRRETAGYFTDTINKTGIPYLLITGNSDFRKNELIFDDSDTVNDFGSFKTFILHDGQRTLTKKEIRSIDSADINDYIFMHHPYSSLKEPYRTDFINWRKEHKETKIINAHLHKFNISENEISLPSLDPDKNIGESPSFIYLDTDTGKIEQSYFYCPPPADFMKRCGISCYNTIEDIYFSAEHRLKSLEIRPNSIKYDRKELINALSLWRNTGGNNLSVHFPNIGYENNEVSGKEQIKIFVDFVKEINADRITVHVPYEISDVVLSEAAFEKIVSFYAEFINSLPENITVGIENLHMKEKYRKNGTHQFGCIPSECIEFLKALKLKTDNRKVGFNLDIGHARNNAPYSIDYPLGVWYAELGADCVGYHLHQVTSDNGAFENHTALTEHYGKLISLASFYKNLSDGILADAPVIFEVRTQNGAAETVEFFENNL